MDRLRTSVAVIGAGIIGIATAYYLVTDHRVRDVLIIDRGQPMAFTSAQSGENYRNWWPHPTMVAFTDRSIDLMEAIARDTGNRIAMTRRGYALATRHREIDNLLAELRFGLGSDADRLIRVHEGASSSYARAERPDWEAAPDGVDILRGRAVIAQAFPSFAGDISTVVHIRRAGDISGQQLGMHMLEQVRAAGGRRITGTVESIAQRDGFEINLETEAGQQTIHANAVVNAAGPFAADIAAMLGVDLALVNVFQQKIAFEDRDRAIPRDLPFSIDLDPQRIDWTDEDRAQLADDPALAWLAEEMPGAIHCRPDGGDASSWVKLGWAYNQAPAPATWDPPVSDIFPEVVLRGAARLNPALKGYYGRLPRSTHHYGGWYTMTEENWPLIGPMGPPGAFVACAMSGFGTMAACAAGELCAAWVAGAERPGYADRLSPVRYQDRAFVAEVLDSGRGVL